MLRMMSTDTIHVEWHLTPRGWVHGDWSANQPLLSTAEPPDDRIETWLKSETRNAASFAPLQTTWSLLWACPHYSEANRKALRQQTRTLAGMLTNTLKIFETIPLE